VWGGCRKGNPRMSWMAGLKKKYMKVVLSLMPLRGSIVRRSCVLMTRDLRTPVTCWMEGGMTLGMGKLDMMVV